MVKVFDSTPKKLAIPLFALFEIGWIVFTAGFGLLLSTKESDFTLKEDDNRKSPLYFPYYMTLVGGQFVAVIGLLHAALPSGRLSSIFGALSTVLNIIYIVSVGYVINNSDSEVQDLRWDIRYHNDDHHDPQLVRAVKLMFAGSITLTASWGIVQLLSQFYERRPQPVQARNLWCVIVECWKNRATFVGDISESVRLSSIPAMLLSAIGWCVFVGGVHHIYYWAYYFGGWCAIFIPPLLYLASLLHAGKPSYLMMGIFASILNAFFVVSMGFSVTSAGKYLYNSPHLLDTASTQQDVEDIQEDVYYNRLILGGGMVCLIFWTVVLVLWPFYRPTETGYSHTTNDEIDNNEYDNDLLLPPPSSSVIINHEEHIAESQENTQQPHMEEYHTNQLESVNA